LHWNKNLFEERFVTIFRQTLDAYVRTSDRTGVQIHAHAGMEKYLQSIIKDFNEFRDISLKGSMNASRRESLTAHAHEYLVSGTKATFCIENYLGGTYYLTPDEIFEVAGRYIIQESKNTTKKALPDLSDIQDGLFKLILYSNIDALHLNNTQVQFSTRLKLTRKNIKGCLVLPCSPERVEEFLTLNAAVLKPKEKATIKKLLLETQRNSNLDIEIGANQ
jgi:hypothetical protein